MPNPDSPKVRGRNVVHESGELVSKGFITPIEHKSLTSLSWQIAANVRANGSTAAMSIDGTDGFPPWI